MTATEIVTVVSAIGVLIATLGGVIVNIIVAIRMKETKAAVAEVSAKTDGIATQVNGASSKAQEQIASLQRDLTAMTAQLAEKKETAALLTQSLANAAATKPVVVEPPKGTT
jgi:uncharacterized protein YoxC